MTATMGNDVATGGANSPALITIARVGVLALGLLTAPILARTLGPAERGVYGAMVSILAVAPVVLGLGLPMAIRRRASRPDISIDSTMRLVNLYLPVIVVVAFVAGGFISDLLFMDLSRSDHLIFSLAVSATSLFVYTLCVQSILIARGKYLHIAILQFLQGGVIAVSTVGLWALGNLSVTSLLWVFMSATLASAVTALCFYNVRIIGPMASPRHLVGESTSFFFTQVAETASATAPLLFVFVLLSERDAGLFTVAITIASVPVALGYAIGAVVFRSAVVASHDERIFVVAKTLKTSLISSCTFCLIVVVVLPFGLPFIFGQQYSDSLVPAIWCIGSAVFSVVAYVTMQLLAAFGRPMIMTVCQATGLIVSLVSIGLLSGLFGLAGAGAGLFVGSSLTAILAVCALKPSWRVFLIHPRDFRGAFILFRTGQIV